MRGCEHFEISLSAFVDGELETGELVPSVDHLVDCASCRSFYRRARSLDELVLDVAAGRAAPSVPDDVWSRIETEASKETRVRAARTVSWRTWAAVAASPILLAVGLWAGARMAPAPLPTIDPKGDYMEVVLEEDRGRMTDDRFVRLTAELLQADRRYHRKMLEVMQVLTDISTGREGSEELRRGASPEGGDYRILMETPGEERPGDLGVEQL